MPGSEWGVGLKEMTSADIQKYEQFETALGARGVAFTWPMNCGSEAAERFYCDPTSGWMECSEYRRHGYCVCMERRAEVWERDQSLGEFRGCFYGLHLDESRTQPKGALNSWNQHRNLILFGTVISSLDFYSGRNFSCLGASVVLGGSD